ncbi:hypothetical protein [Mycetohabitans endofungorum]|uniref:hypothetical protein n=1 Tax=Mycetohabitans endofungorum TaxID=417203 RepID=UPI002B06089D|nr:hypothetical protein [Mycetohabitans endofungorum]
MAQQWNLAWHDRKPVFHLQVLGDRSRHVDRLIMALHLEFVCHHLAMLCFCARLCLRQGKRIWFMVHFIPRYAFVRLL